MRNTATTLGLLLEPLDVLFFRDGRPFTGAERSVSGLPLPQTLAGAIRTALLRHVSCDFARMRGAPTFREAVERACGEKALWIAGVEIRGPWLARADGDGGSVEPFVPAPAILRQRARASRNDEPLSLLQPLRAGLLPGWDPPENHEELRPLWLRNLEPTEPAPGFLNTEGLARFLRGQAPLRSHLVEVDDLLGLDYRTGIGIEPGTLVAAEGQIFGRGFLALKKGVVFYAEVAWPANAPEAAFVLPSIFPFGGEGRHVRLRLLANPVAWPQVEPDADRKPLVLLATPCPFQSGWKPQGLQGHVIAAAVPESLPFSGWDLARGGPKPTRFAVPAGSVYFLESSPSHWPRSLAESEEEHRQGWGSYLKGVWTDA